MPSHGILVFKHPATGNWLDNLNQNGYRLRVKDGNGIYRWILMTKDNTRVMNHEHDPAKHSPDDPVYPRWTQLL